MYFQELILRLQHYWHEQGCLLTQPYDLEKGAGTFNPNTFLRALGPEPFNAAYVEPCRRPTDGRYGQNPIRMQHYYQFQVVMKPSPLDIVDRYLGSLKSIGIDPEEHDIRLVHDDWESPTLGAWGLGWEVWADGMEVTQFTYFQQVGGMELPSIMGEITYGLERICMFLQKVDSVYEIAYNSHFTYGDLFHENEIQFSTHNFEQADVNLQTEMFHRYEEECRRLCAESLPLPAADYCLKASHAFNLLDARGAISVSERQNYILRVRTLSRAVAEAWIACRERLQFPLCREKTPEKRTPATIETNSATATAEASTDFAPLLLELGVEEMPARVFSSLPENLSRVVKKLLDETGLEYDEPSFFFTPRRLAVAVPRLAMRQPDRVEEQKGPPLRIARDEAGNWTRAALGFARRNNLDVEALSVRAVKGVDYLFARVEQPGRPTLEIMSELVPRIFQALHWYKTMRWGEGDCAFVRPVQWLVALLGDQVVPCSFGGVTAGSCSRGHRFLAPAPIQLTNADGAGYLAALNKARVVVDQQVRRQMIRDRLVELGAEQGLKWREDEALLNEVCALVEYPVPLLCSFAPRYLEIPEAVLVSEMKEHQRYFAFTDASGKLANSFVAVSNMICRDPDIVRQGYEKVLRSRFADAEFFLREDRKIPLESRIPELGKVVFQQRLGTYLDKVERVRTLSAKGAALLEFNEADSQTADHIARLCKTDLVTLMVGEFPELQGEIGTYYAHCEGLPDTVAEGIRGHYLPRGAHDVFPESAAAALVGIADRLDTLIGIFALDRMPTGSADPFALRRACLACIRLILQQNFSLDIRDMIREGIALYQPALPELDTGALTAKILDFFRNRACRLFQDEGRNGAKGFRYDTIDAVVQAELPWTDFSDLLLRLEAMRRFRERAEANEVAATFKRANNILRGLDLSPELSVDPDLFQHKEEREVFLAVRQTAEKMQQDLAHKQYENALQEVVPLRTLVDRFFDAVLVNDPDKGQQQNRQILVRSVVELVRRIADFSALQG